MVYRQAGPYRPPDKPEHPQTYFSRLADALYVIKEHNVNNTISQVDGLPLLGNVLDFRNKRLELLLRTSETCGDVGAFHLGQRPVVVINEAQLIQEVLVEQAYSFSKPSNVRRLLRPIIGDGSFLLEGDAHRSRRKLLSPFFQPRQVAKYTEKMFLAIERWQEQISHKSVINVNEEMFRLTLSVVGETIFSIDMLNETQPIGKAVTFIMQYVSDNLSTAFPIPPSWPTARNRKYHQAIKVLNETLQYIISNRTKGDEEPSDILHVLLSDPTLSADDARGEALNLFIGGQESPTSALSWIWWLLSQHPDIYQRVQSEVDEVLGNERFQFDTLNKTPYTVQVIREALRLYPPAYIIPRKTVDKVTLSSGHILPPETRVIVSPYTLHRREDYFPNANTFNPERFAPGYEQNISKYAYLPFGVGPHTCIGGYFAMLEMQIALITTLQKFRLELLPGQTVTPNPLIALRPSTFHMRVTPR